MSILLSVLRAEERRGEHRAWAVGLEVMILALEARSRGFDSRTASKSLVLQAPQEQQQKNQQQRDSNSRGLLPIDFKAISLTIWPCC